MNAQTRISHPSRAAWRKLLPALILLLLVPLACNLPLGGPTAPENRPTVQANPQTDWRSVIANAKPGDTVSIQFTETDLTQIAAAALANQDDPNVRIEDPRVILRDGKMEIYGRANTQAVSANFRVDVVVNVDQNSQPHMEITSADFGGIPVPDSLRQSLQERLDAGMQGALASASDRFKTQEVIITDGLMTINGTVQ